MSDDRRRPSHAESARTLLAGSSRGVLATIAAEDGYPYGSIVELLPDDDGAIVLFLSTLAEHTKNFTLDDRVSVVVAESFEDGVLASGRATYRGRIAELDSPDAYRDAYLELHPAAATYIDFSDFSFYRVAVEQVRWIGGFGRMSWIDAQAYRGAEVDPLVDVAPGAIEHMNDDHADNLLEYAHAFTDAAWAAEARMIRLDRYGFDLSVSGGGRAEEVGIEFDEDLADPGDVRSVMVELARRARERTEGAE